MLYEVITKWSRFPAVTGLHSLSGDRVLIGFALNHYESVVDKDFNQLFAIGKAGNGYIGKFINLAGLYEMVAGNLIITDPALTSIQVFDGKDGRYLYHIGDESGAEDPIVITSYSIHYTKLYDAWGREALLG